MTDAPRAIVNLGELPLEFSSTGIRFGAATVEFGPMLGRLDSGRIGVDAGATGHHREDATFGARGRLRPMGYWEGEDLGEAE